MTDDRGSRTNVDLDSHSREVAPTIDPRTAHLMNHWFDFIDPSGKVYNYAALAWYDADELDPIEDTYVREAWARPSASLQRGSRSG